MKTIIPFLCFAASLCSAQEQPSPAKAASASEDYTIREKSTVAADQAGRLAAPSQLAAVQQKEPPPDFLPVDKLPQPIEGQMPMPLYPDSARRTGTEGMVWVKIWIDERGNARKAEVVKSDNAIFDHPSIDAAMEWKFSPAILQGKPVAVWVTLPFKYKLGEKGLAHPDRKDERKPSPKRNVK